MIPAEVIERIRAGTELLGLVKEKVNLKKSGSSEYFGRCPFHDEHTPSFYVVPKDGFYYCFGCGEHGDVFKWVQTNQRLKFGDAVTFLADRLGLQIGQNGRKVADFNSSEWKKMQKVMREQAKERERERTRKQAEAARRAEARWNGAKKITSADEHSYFKRKGITDPKGLRIEYNLILVPMRGLEPGAPLLSIQQIAVGGSKRFTKNSRVKNTRASVGTEFMERMKGGSKKVDVEQDGVIYVCEGWATGWTISHVTKRPVLVAFTANNLKAVALHARKTYANMTLVIAADNDRWKKLRTKGQKPRHNPGVTIGQEAAKAAKAAIVAPDFDDLEKKPTDFNDLWLAEGADAVRVWLDPANFKKCRTVFTPPPGPGYETGEPKPKGEPPPGPEIELGEEEDVSTPDDSSQVVGSIAPPDEESTEAPDDDPGELGDEAANWLDTKPFRLLGHNHGVFYYITKAGGQIVNLTPGKHERASELYQLAPHAWWEYHFPGKSGVNQKAAADALIQASYRKGVFRGDNVRGRGCWQDEDEKGDLGLVLHLGDRLVVPGNNKAVNPEEYESYGGYMYEAMQRLKGPHKQAMEVDESREILDIFRSLLWADAISGDLLAGWTVLAPVCGALTWRPHVWLTGERGCGKSSVATDFIVPLLAGGSSEIGGMALYVQGESTEAGVRQSLRADAFPVVFDEAEEGEGVGNRIQKVLALARQSSTESDARTLKGTVHGSSLQFRIRSMFCLASIGGAVYQESDKSRICMLPLRGESQVDPALRLTHWAKLKPRLFAITPDAGRRLFTRTVKMLRDGRLEKTVATFRKSGGVVFGDQRMGDQYGTLMAGSWMLSSDEVPSESDAREMLAAEEVHTYQADQIPEGKKALQILLQQRERVDTAKGVQTLAIGELVDVCTEQAPPEIQVTVSEATRVLRQIGMKVKYDGEWVLYVAPLSEWMAKALTNTMYARGVQVVLRGLDGVTMTDRAIRFHSGMACRAIRVPVKLLEFDDES